MMGLNSWEGVRTRLASNDGTRFLINRTMLAPGSVSGTQRTTSIDRIGLLSERVVAVALDGSAVSEQAWRGAEAVIKRDRPIFLAYAQGHSDRLDDLKSLGYSIRPFECWTYPKSAAVVLVAVPSDQEARLFGGLAPSVVLPHPSRASNLDRDNPLLVPSVFEPREIEIVFGFYKPERDGHLTWIWSGPGKESTFVLPQRWFGLQRFRVSILDVSGGTARDLKFRVNGKKAFWWATDNYVDVEAYTEAGDFSGRLDVSVIVPKTARPSDDDTRRLGCCISKIEMEWE